jgi:hypothetical protein
MFADDIVWNQPGARTEVWLFSADQEAEDAFFGA